MNRAKFKPLLAIGFLHACVPTLVIVDRASVIEEESAGDWPEIERDLGLLEANLEPAVQLLDQGSASPALKILPTGGHKAVPLETSAPASSQPAEKPAEKLEVQP